MSEQIIKGVVSVIPDGLVKPAGTITITQNGNYNVSKYVIASVNVESGGSGVTYPSYDKTFEGNAKLDNGNIVLLDTNGITLKTANTLVEEDLKITVDESAVNETTYETYAGQFTGNAELVEGYTVNIVYSTISGSDYVLVTSTSVKVNEAPTSDSDYDEICDMYSTIGETHTYEKVKTLYIWGWGYSINGGAIQEVNYDHTVIEPIEITEDCTVELYFYEISSGGGWE